MAFQRALWHSGLDYKQFCPTCKKTVIYTDEALDFRPWYPDGFVDCPNCKTHLRHNEKYAVNAPVEQSPNQASAPASNGASPELFCHNCGTKFENGHNFCPICGTKRG